MKQVLLTQYETGWYTAEVPSLPGCISQGETVAEALKNIQEAIELYISVLIEDGKPIPEDVLPITVVSVAA